jgi:hypothetical protein
MPDPRHSRSLSESHSTSLPEGHLRSLPESHVETQRPERLPLDLGLEAHISADGSSIAYRRGLKRLGLGQVFCA